MTSQPDAATLLAQLRKLDATWPRGHYVSRREMETWRRAHPPPCTPQQVRQIATQLDGPDGSDLVTLAIRFHKPSAAIEGQNERWVKQVLDVEKEHFDAVGSSGLTPRQRHAIVTDADITLAVAGAGTGKTTTIVEKVRYLLRNRLARPSEILVLAYNKEAQRQLEARINDGTSGAGVRAQTFHAFGYRIVRTAAQDERGPDPFTEQDSRGLVQRELDQIRRDTSSDFRLRAALNSFRNDMATAEKNATFVSNVLNFLGRYKTRQANINHLRRFARTLRQRDFLTIFEHLLNAYERRLHERNLLDFSDMIVKATGHIERGEVPLRYRYILIDEFQDITRARWGLIQAIRSRLSDAKLFLVGDDWQSIYAFDDSDVSIMTELQERETGVERIDLDTTFRFPQKLADISSHFVMRNPAQLRKEITSANGQAIEQPIVRHPYRESEPSHTRERVIRRIVQDIASNAPTGTSVLMLGRYRKGIPDNWNELTKIARESGLELKYHTCHAAKGLEADQVILLDINGGVRGFPSRIPDDEFIQLLPTPAQAYDDAEERRVFYVALTRTRGRVHLVFDETKPSSFIDELSGRPIKPAPKPTAKSKRSKEPAERLPIPEDAQGRTPHCPSCHQPTFVKRVGKNGPFWGCSDFPKCWGRPKKCPSCHQLAFVLDAPHGSRYCAECGWTA